MRWRRWPGSMSVCCTIVEQALVLSGATRRRSARKCLLSRSSWRATYIRIGRVQGLPGTANLGDREGAIHSFRNAQTLIEPLARSSNPALESVEVYVEATRRLSEVLLPNAEQRDEAGRQAQMALAVAQRVSDRQRPNDVKARNLARQFELHRRDGLYRPQRRSPSGKATGGLYNALLADDADNPENQRNAALVDKYLGAQYQARGDSTQALQHFQRALALDEKAPRSGAISAGHATGRGDLARQRGDQSLGSTES